MFSIALTLAVLTVISALGVVFSQKTLNSALSLVVTLFLVAAHFALLGADFLASLQVMIYAGAIMVLVVFVIMLLGLEQPADGAVFGVPTYIAALFCGLLVGILIFAISNSFLGALPVTEIAVTAGTPEAVGNLLLTKYVFPFQLAGLLLLAAVVGAVVLAHEPKRPLAAGRGLAAIRRKYAQSESEK